MTSEQIFLLVKQNEHREQLHRQINKLNRDLYFARHHGDPGDPITQRLAEAKKELEALCPTNS